MTLHEAKHRDDPHNLYAYCVSLHGFDPLAERDVVAEAEALLTEVAK